MSKWSTDRDEFLRRVFIGRQHPRCDGILDGLAVTSRADETTLRDRETCVECGERPTVPGKCAVRCRSCVRSRAPDGW